MFTMGPLLIFLFCSHILLLYAKQRAKRQTAGTRHVLMAGGLSAACAPCVMMATMDDGDSRTRTSSPQPRREYSRPAPPSCLLVCCYLPSPVSAICLCCWRFSFLPPTFVLSLFCTSSLYVFAPHSSMPHDAVVSRFRSGAVCQWVAW